jgi:NADH-quinone oxidoreductase subunit G
MNHVGTICTHCSNGCKTTLGVRNDEIVRANNRDRSGLNDEFLCAKGRFGFDFNRAPERLTAPLVRKNGRLEEVSWSEALRTVAARFSEVKAGGGSFGVVAGPHLTNEEAYFLQKFARQGLGTANLDHARSGDVPALVGALSGVAQAAMASIEDLYQTKAALVIGADLAQQHPFLAWQLRANHRHHGARVYTVTPGPVREDKYSAAQLRYSNASEMDAAIAGLHDRLKAEPELVILFGDAIRGSDTARLVAFGASLGIPVKYVPLVDYSNSRGVSDMGLYPHLGPGYKAAAVTGAALPEMLSDHSLQVFWAVGSDALAQQPLASGAAFVVVQDLFLTETAGRADVVLPSASAYEKSGTVTNVCGQVQRLKPAVRTMGTKGDLEIMGLLAREMGLNLGIWTPDAILEEIRTAVNGYNVPLPVIRTGSAAMTSPVNGAVPLDSRPELIRSAGDTLFTSGVLGRYSKMLTSVQEFPGALYKG